MNALPRRSQEVERRVLTSRQLDLILALGRARSLRGAAAGGGLSQSAMTRQLQLMEARIGVRLAERSAAGVRLTEAGERLLALAQITRRLESELLFELSSETPALRGHVRICGFSSVMRSVVMPSLLPLLRAQSALTVQCLSEELYLVANRGTTGDTDLFITQVPQHVAGVSSFVLGHEYNVLVESATVPTPADVLIDHEPNDRFSEYYLSLTGLPIPAPLRRLFFADIYGLLDGVRAGAGRAVIPVHLFEPGDGVRVVAGSTPLRVPVVLNLQSQLLELSAPRAVVEEIRARAPHHLARNALNVDLGGAVDGAFAGPAHRYVKP